MSELLFTVHAQYEEVIELRKEMVRLKNEMMGLDTSTKEGEASMDSLSKKYLDCKEKLDGIVNSASEAAIKIKEGVSDIDSATLNLMKGISDSEDNVGNFFAGVRGQLKAAKETLNDMLVTTNDLIAQRLSDLEELRKTRNELIAEGDEKAARGINEQIDAIDEQIAGYREMVTGINHKIESINEESDAVDELIGKYETLMENQEEPTLTDDEYAEVQREMGRIIDDLIDKTGKFQGKIKDIAEAYKSAKKLVDIYNKSIKDTAVGQATASASSSMLQKASLNLGVALTKMGLSAKAAAIAVNALKVALPTVAITAVIAIITSLIKKHSELKQAAEETKQKELETFEEIGKAAAPAIAKYEELRSKYSELRTEMEKRQFIDDNKKALDDLGVSVSNVKEADDLLINGVEAYVKAQIRYAEADLYRADAQGKIAKAASLRRQIEEAERTGATKVVNQKMTLGEAYKIQYGENYDTSKLKNADAIITVGREVKEADLLKDELKVLEDEIADGYKKAEEVARAGDRAIQAVGEMGPQQLGKSLQNNIDEAKANWERYRAEVENIRANADRFSSQQLADAMQNEAEWKKKYEELSGEKVNPKTTPKKKSTTKSDEEKALKEREDAIKKYNERIASLIASVEDDIAKEQISAIENNYEAVSRQFDLEKQMLIDKAEEVGQTMTDLFNGNVDLLNRKTIDAVKLAEKGWEDAGEGIATVFSSQYGVNDSTGKAREILVTPILPNGEVLSQKELEDYIYNTLEGAEDMLSADTKGIVIAVDVDEESGEQLNEMQETYYELRGLIDEYDNLKRTNNEKERLDQENKDRREYIKQYGEYIERLDVLNEEYQERLSKAENEWQKQSINKEWQSAVSDLKREYEPMTELIFQDAGRLTNNELTRAIEETQKAIKKATDSGDIEALTELYARLREQQSEDFSRNSRSGFAAIGQGFGLRRSANEKRSTADELENEMRSYEDVLRAESINSLMDEEEVDKLRTKIKLLREEIKRLRGDANIDEDNALKSLTSGFSYAEASLKKIAPMLKSFQSDTNEWGNALYEVGVAFEGIAGAIDLSSKLLDTKLSEAQRKDIIFDSALSVALQLTQEIVKGIQEEVELSKQLELNTTAFANALKLANLSVDESKFKSVFGADSLALMSEYAIKATESLRETQKAMSELYNVEYNAPTAPGGRASQEQFAQYQTYQKAIEEGQRGLQAMVVKTKDRNGFLNFLGIPDAYSTLGDLAPNIFNDDGTLKIAELKTFLDSDLSEVLSAEQRQALQGAVDLNEKYEENIKGLKDALSGVFGSVSNGLADAIIDGLRNGTDVSTDYLKNQMNGVVESLEKQMVNGMIMKYLDQYQEKALAMMEAGGGPEDLLNLLNEALDGMDGVVNTAKMSAELFEERAKEKGYDLSSKAQYQQQATYGAFQTMSQDVGTELNGRFSAVQINTENTVAQLQLCHSTLSDVLNAQLNSGSFIEDIHKIQADSYLALLAIRDNTEGNYHEVETIRGLLETIRNNTNRL